MTDDPTETRPARKKFGEVRVTGPKGDVWIDHPDAYRPCPAPTAAAYRETNRVTIENAHEMLDNLSTRAFYQPEITSPLFQIDTVSEKQRYTAQETHLFKAARIPILRLHSELTGVTLVDKTVPLEEPRAEVKGVHVAVTLHSAEEVCGPLPTPAAKTVATPPSHADGKKGR